jgi:hypothetical protein
MGVQDIPEKEEESDNDNKKLWFQGPSYSVFRRCFHYSTEDSCTPSKDVIDTIETLNSKMQIRFPDNSVIPVSKVRWGWDDAMHEWSEEFPDLE